MEGSTYLATPLPPPKSINHRGYPLRLEMEAPERKQLVLGARINRLGKCKKDNPRDFIESDIYFDRTGFNRGFQFETQWQGCSTRRNVEDEQFIKRWSFLNKARILILLLRILGRLSLMFPLWVVVEEKGRFATRRSAQNIFCQMITPSHALLLWRQQITSWSISAKGTRPSLISSFIIWGRN